MRTFRLVSALRVVRPTTFFNDPPAEGEGGDTGDTGQSNTGGNKGGGDSGDGGSGKTRTYSQEEVNRLLARDRHKDRTEKEQLAKKLQMFQEHGLTEDVKQQLEATIETLQNEGKTKEQLAKEEKDRLEKKHQTELTKAKTDADHWKKQFQSFKIERDLLDAAGSAEVEGEKRKAKNSKQILALLLPSTTLVEELNPTDKKPTGRYNTRVTMTELKDGEEVTLSLSPAEAVARLAASEEHFNLFESGLNGGLGTYNQSTSAASRKVPATMDEYMKQRSKNRNARNGQ